MKTVKKILMLLLNTAFIPALFSLCIVQGVSASNETKLEHPLNQETLINIAKILEITYLPLSNDKDLASRKVIREAKSSIESGIKALEARGSVNLVGALKSTFDQIDSLNSGIDKLLELMDNLMPWSRPTTSYNRYLDRVFFYIDDIILNIENQDYDAMYDSVNNLEKWLYKTEIAPDFSNRYLTYKNFMSFLKTKLDSQNISKIDDSTTRILDFFKEYYTTFIQNQSSTERNTAIIIFNWLESLFPDLLPPNSQQTQEFSGIILRYYPETNIFLATFEDHLFFIDHLGNVHDLGEVDFWLNYIDEENTNSVTISDYWPMSEDIQISYTNNAQISYKSNQNLKKYSNIFAQRNSIGPYTRTRYYAYDNDNLKWYGTQYVDGSYSVARTPWNFGSNAVIGKRSTLNTTLDYYYSNHSNAGSGRQDATWFITGPEQITVPAGTFQAYVLELRENWASPWGSGTNNHKYWLVKGIGPVRIEIEDNDETDSFEMTNYNNG